jgi:hypothetical protein
MINFHKNSIYKVSNKININNDLFNNKNLYKLVIF